MKVLVIDDEKGILKMYGDYLTMNGIEVLQASDGATGIKIAKEQKPDVIFLDIIMPRYNGLDVLKEMKAQPEIQKIPVFLLTNLPAEGSSEKAKEYGASGYLVKAQYEPKMVLSIVQNAVNKKLEI